MNILLWFYSKFDKFDYSIWWVQFLFRGYVHFNYNNYDKSIKVILCFKYSNYHNYYDILNLISNAIWVDLFIINYCFQIVGIVHRALPSWVAQNQGPSIPTPTNTPSTKCLLLLNCGWTLIKLIDGFTLVTNYVINRPHI
jgi:hypothetical protein